MEPYPQYGPPQYQTPWQPGPGQGPILWPPPYAYTAPRYRPSAPLVAGIVLVLVGFILAIVALPTAWWSVNLFVSSPGSTMSGKIDFNSGTVCETLTGYVSGCVTYPSEFRAMADVLTGTFVLVLLGLIFAILAFVFLIVGIFRRWARYVVAAMGIAASALLISAAVYAIAAVPGAFNSMSALGSGEGVTGFFGHTSYSVGGMTEDMTYGGGLAWYMSIASFVLVLLGTLIGIAGIRPVPRPQAMPYWAAPPAVGYYGAPPAPVAPESPAPTVAPLPEPTPRGPPPGEGEA